MIRLLDLIGVFGISGTFVVWLFSGCVSTRINQIRMDQEFWRGRTEGLKISLEILKQSEREDAMRDLEILLGCSQWDLK